MPIIVAKIPTRNIPNLITHIISLSDAYKIKLKMPWVNYYILKINLDWSIHIQPYYTGKSKFRQFGTIFSSIDQNVLLYTAVSVKCLLFALCQMFCTCLSDALYMLDRCFGLLDRWFGLLVICLMGCFTSSCQLSDKERKAHSKRLTEMAVYNKTFWSRAENHMLADPNLSVTNSTCIFS